MARKLGLMRREREMVGEVMMNIRKGRGLTQTQLAGELGVSQAYLSNFETARGHVSAEKVWHLLRALLPTDDEGEREFGKVVNSIPDLLKEDKFKAALIQAYLEGGLEAHGIATWIAERSGMSDSIVRQRLARLAEKRRGNK